VQSLNFEFLRKVEPNLAEIAALAERLIQIDPASAAVKLRSFAEEVVERVFTVRELPRPYKANLNDLLGEQSFLASTPKIIINLLHGLRTTGNRGAHGKPVDSQTATGRLRDAQDLGRWVFVSLHAGDPKSTPRLFQEPPPETSRGELRRQKAKLLEELRQRDELLEKALQESHAARESAALAEAAKGEVERERQRTPEELRTLREQGEAVASTLHLSEEQTRRSLINEQLLSAGWDVGQEVRSTDEVGQEVVLHGLPTKTGEGRADYVLWDDNGKPLAVVEAKRTAKDPKEGRVQAEQYADSLEKQYGQRPIIFYTNGPEIFMWDDAQKYTPRTVYGYYSKASLQRLHFQRRERDKLSQVGPSPTIAGRMYQVEAIKRVCERFEARHRRALIVQATGTGKTRVAISLCDVLLRAKWAKRILFLCDRRELQKQAFNAFKNFLPSETRTYVNKETPKDTKHRVFIATYPAMMNIYEDFDVGFFDLVIADESHRSIYNKYRDLFLYFDSLQVGLTATPVKYVERNTYRLFGCESQDPTFNYTFDEAVKNQPPYLCSFRVVKVTTQFLRDGIKYNQMSPEQRAALEADHEDAAEIDYDQAQVDKQVFNKDTNRTILRNLMDNGIRIASGAHPGKTILFARSHEHAVLLNELFDEMYPMYGGKLCRVIDNYEPRAEQLIDNFKDPAHELTIAISVDMLDTGIDVPEVVNLVFAKPVKSFVKFWQMIGRGTRRCPDLFGPGQDKTEFLIFDHWGNFEFFEERYEEKEPSVSRSLGQQLFEARVELMDAAIKSLDDSVRDKTAEHLRSMLLTLRSTNAIPVREHWKTIEQLSASKALQQWHPATKAELLSTVAPLMHLIPSRGEEAALRFDTLMTRLQAARLRGTTEYETHRAKVSEQVENLQMNLNQVRAKADTIRQVRNNEFWAKAQHKELEQLREELRGIMRHMDDAMVPDVSARVLDVRDGGLNIQYHTTSLVGLELVEYRNRVKKTLLEKFDSHLILRKIRANIRVSDADVRKLAELVLECDPEAPIERLLSAGPSAEVPMAKDRLQFVLRGIVGLDAECVEKAFTEFTHSYPGLSARQVQFLILLKNHIGEHGMMTLEELDRPPFTTFDAAGIDGVFTDEEQVDRLLVILARFDPQNVQSESRSA
jgi:type I restriction enzyme R subunit